MRQNNSSEWISEALEQYEKPLLQYAWGIVRRREVAQDAVQETFLKLSQTPFNEVHHKLKPWLYTVCRHLCFDFLKKEKNMASLDPEMIQEYPGNEPLPSKSLESEEKNHDLQTILKKLPPNQQEVLRLKFLHQMSYREISHVTKLSESNVGFLIHSGIKTLRQRVTQF